MSKMMGKNKKFGRCPVKGHSHCEVSEEIQDQPIGRTAEKNQRLREVSFSDEALSGLNPISKKRAEYIRKLADRALIEAMK